MVVRAGIFMLRKSELQFYCKPSQPASQPAHSERSLSVCACRAGACRPWLLTNALPSADQDGASHIYPDR